MKISLNWIAQYVEIADLKPEEIIHQLATKTCEVEALQAYGSGLDEVVLAKVVECAKHPNADRLSVTKVDVGGTFLPIVCGASNVKAGQTVAVAKPGVTLPDGLQLKVAKLRGVESHGMILSEKEMGLSEESEGIWVSDGEEKPGTRFYEKMPVRDFILEIDNKSLTHRPDLWGHYGFAREIAAIYRRPLKPLSAKTKPVPSAKEAIAVEIQDPSGCSRYLALCIRGIRVGPSPAWLRSRLKALGQRSINNVVDLTNYLLFETGQPTHAFDARAIRGGKIVVRRAKAGESLITLDGVTRKLSATDLLISDTVGPLALAGVMGGQGSEINPNTTDIVLESAAFDAVSVRRSSQAHTLRTEASARFEKSLDPHFASHAVQGFLQHLESISVGASAYACAELPQSGYQEKKKTISLSPTRVGEKLGVSIEEKEMRDILGRLEFSVQESRDRWEITVPSFRATKDVSIEEDLIEEIGRLYGYDRIPESNLSAPVLPPPPEEERIWIREIKNRFSKGYGFTEALHYSFLSDALAAKLELEKKNYIRLENPIIVEQSRVRRTLLPQLLEDLESALRKSAEIRLFEIGKGYDPDHSNERGEALENLELSAVWAWREKKAGEQGFLKMKGLVHSLLAELRVGTLDEEALNLKETEWNYLQSGQSISLQKESKSLGCYGQVDPKKLTRLGISGAACALVLNLRSLLSLAQPVFRFQALPKFPGLSVDVALAVPLQVPYRELEKKLWAAGKPWLSQLENFDRFLMKDGRKSYAFHALLISPERTLTDREQADFIEKAASVAKELGGELRR